MIRPRKQPDICQGTCSLTFRQYSTEDTDFSSVISIHAPAEGATNTVGGVMADYKLFQSTLPRRERREAKTLFQKIKEFQSTLPRRERQEQDKPSGGAVAISIHAPAEGATSGSH